MTAMSSLSRSRAYRASILLGAMWATGASTTSWSTVPVDDCSSPYVGDCFEAELRAELDAMTLNGRRPPSTVRSR